MHAFTTLAAPTEHQTEVKGSVFIAHAVRADEPQAALGFLNAVAGRYPDATHLCWAYRIGGQYRFSDGGEPGGTAGQPILRAIEGQDLDHVVAGVIRYFGGTKLGAGGLVRAYGGTAAEALRQAQRCIETPRTEITVEIGFEHIGALYHLLDTLDAEKQAEQYTSSGVKLLVSLPGAHMPRLRQALSDATRGQFTLEESPEV
jgi:uncharacterized YigZ family protein